MDCFVSFCIESIYLPMKTTYIIYSAKSGVHLLNEIHLRHLYRKKWCSTGE
ncbi:hypothetical protein M1D49_13365 [Bacillus sp. PK3-056]|uniref:hypothetical protein n=1 Tax=Niallia circulans TaxID=1397 RepID=UPI0019D30E98|nr:hypothetical protein [Niallia circulans]